MDIKVIYHNYAAWVVISLGWRGRLSFGLVLLNWVNLAGGSGFEVVTRFRFILGSRCCSYTWTHFFFSLGLLHNTHRLGCVLLRLDWVVGGILLIDGGVFLGLCSDLFFRVSRRTGFPDLAFLGIIGFYLARGLISGFLGFDFRREMESNENSRRLIVVLAHLSVVLVVILDDRTELSTACTCSLRRWKLLPKGYWCFLLCALLCPNSSRSIVTSLCSLLITWLS